jgi:GT2 family glycosyltransferase
MHGPTIAELTHWGAEQEQSNWLLEKDLAAMDELLAKTLEEMQSTNARLQAITADRDHQLQLQRQLRAQSEQAVGPAAAQPAGRLRRIQSRLAQAVRTLGKRALPANTWRRGVARLGLRSYRLCRTEGVRVFSRKATRLCLAAFRDWRTEGLRACHRKIVQRMFPLPPAPAAPIAIAPPPPVDTRNAYEVWIDNNEPRPAEVQRQRLIHFAHEPLISVVVPTYNTPIVFLTAMLDSVIQQTYGNWELCIADGASADQVMKSVLRRYCRRDPRIKVSFLLDNRGIGGNSAAALSLATGEFVTFLDHDDTLAPHALFEVVRMINQEPEADVLYTDEDKIDETGIHRSEAHFKPDWSPDTLRSHNYICHLSIYRRSLVNEVGGMRSGFDGSQDYDLILRASEKARQIVHIPQVLYHWRIHQASTASGMAAKPYAIDAAKRALTEHLVRCGYDAEICDGFHPGTYQVVHRLPEQPLVTIIILNMDMPETLDRCLQSIARSSYTNYEILLVENNSQRGGTFEYYERLKQDRRIRILGWEWDFNYSAINNFAAEHAQGEVLLLLNNDVEVINEDWLERMLGYALQPEVGAVGAKLYYPNGTIQHGGVIVGMGGVGAHVHTGAPRECPGYFARLLITQNLSAVTGACLMMRREVFREIGGLDEQFRVAYNDVDLCMRIRDKGQLIVWTPHAQLYHHESLSRGQDDTPEKRKRFDFESNLFLSRWAQFMEAGDPYYNPNLTLGRCDFSLNMERPRPLRRRHKLQFDQLRAARLATANAAVVAEPAVEDAAKSLPTIDRCQPRRQNLKLCG